MMNSSELAGTVRTLWRFPVKSTLGEQVDVAEVGEGGIVGDREYAVRDRHMGKVASAKNLARRFQLMPVLKTYGLPGWKI